MSGRCTGSDEKVMGGFDVSVHVDGVFAVASPEIPFMRGIFDLNDLF